MISTRFFGIRLVLESVISHRHGLRAIAGLWISLRDVWDSVVKIKHLASTSVGKYGIAHLLILR